MSETPAQLSRPPLSRKRRRLFRGILLAFFFGFAEIVSCISLRVLDQYYPMDPLAKITPAKVDGYLKKTYDPALGWAPRPTGPEGDINSLGARSHHEYTDLKNTISVYGDSYTHCDGVEVKDSWPILLESKIERGVLNFGVGGYGTDQALMRLEKTHPIAPSQTVLLCIQPENINRNVSIYRGFYQSSFGPPKPYYTVENGKLELHNPFSDPAVVRSMLLDDPTRLIDECREHDRWFNDELIFGRPWGIRFPYSFQLANRIPFIYNRLHIALTDIPSHAYLYREKGDAFELMKAICRRFVAYCRERKLAHGILILPPPRDVARFSDRGELNYQELIDFLKSEPIDFHDMIYTLAKEPDMYSLYVNKSGHYSRKGNELIAGEVAGFIRSIEAR